MTIKDRPGRRMQRILATLTMMIPALLGLGVPNPALAEQHVRTAPYDFGSRCFNGHAYQTLQELPPPLEPHGYQTVTCQQDLLAQTTGIIGEVSAFHAPQPSIGFGGQSSHSWMGIAFSVTEPGIVTVQVDAVTVRTIGVCVHISETNDPRGSALNGRTCGSEFPGGPVTVSHEATAPLPGQYWIFVRAFGDASIHGLLPTGGAAIVTGITHEVSGS